MKRGPFKEKEFLEFGNHKCKGSVMQNFDRIRSEKRVIRSTCLLHSPRLGLCPREMVFGTHIDQVLSTEPNENRPRTCHTRSLRSSPHNENHAMTLETLKCFEVSRLFRFAHGLDGRSCSHCLW